MKYIEGQVLLAQAYVMRSCARIQSGVYRNRVVYKGLPNPGEPHEQRLTSEELLQDEHETLDRHIQRLSELVDNLYKEGK